MKRVLFSVGVSILGLRLIVACAACGAGLTPADEAHIAAQAAIIARCQAEGRACKADGGTGCFGTYDSCMRDGGLR